MINATDYIKITNNPNIIKKGGYIKYFNKASDNYKSGIVLMIDYPLIRLKSFINNNCWYINCYENEIYYKQHTVKKGLRYKLNEFLSNMK